MRAAMNPGITPKSIALLFPVVVVLYLAVFYGIEHVRHRKGPWEVDFQTNADGAPRILVSQASIGLEQMAILFHTETASNATGHVSFDQVRRPVPFGRVLYEDLTFLPGVVTFDLFGHEIELLPRVLFVNKKEIKWKSESVVELSTTNKPAQPPKPAPDYR